MTPCFQHDSYQASCADCRDMNGDDQSMTKVCPVTEAEIARIIREHHRTHVRQPSRTNEPRRTFHQGDKEAALEILAALEAARIPDPEAAKLREALDALAQAEATYRYAHDVLGTGDPKTGRAWDLMKRAGDKARAALNPSPALVGDEGGGTSSR